jgi:hypothetical protein
MLAGVSAALAQSGAADAFVAKIPSANIPSTVILSASAAYGLAGQMVSVPIALSSGGSGSPVSFQMDLTFDPTKLTFVSASGLSSTVVSTSDIRLSTSGTNQNGIASGVVGHVSFTLSASFGTATTAIGLVNCMSAAPSGNRLSTGCLAGTVGLLTCPVTGDADASVADVQAMINQALGASPPVNDINQDGVVNLVDVQLVLNAAMGGACLN